MWSSCLVSVQSQHCRKWGGVCKILALWRKRLEAGIRGNFWLCCKLETSLGYRRPCLKGENCFLCLNIFFLCVCKTCIISHIRKKYFIFRKNTYYLMLKNVIQRSYKAAQPVKVLDTKPEDLGWDQGATREGDS